MLWLDRRDYEAALAELRRLNANLEALRASGVTLNLPAGVALRETPTGRAPGPAGREGTTQSSGGFSLDSPHPPPCTGRLEECGARTAGEYSDGDCPRCRPA